MKEEKACHANFIYDSARLLSGSMICRMIILFSAKIFLSRGVFAEKKRMFVRVSLLLFRLSFCAMVRQGIICPPDLPATQQIVFVFMFVLSAIAFFAGLFFRNYF